MSCYEKHSNVLCHKSHIFFQHNGLLGHHNAMLYQQYPFIYDSGLIMPALRRFLLFTIIMSYHSITIPCYSILTSYFTVAVIHYCLIIPNCANTLVYDTITMVRSASQCSAVPSKCLSF